MDQEERVLVLGGTGHYGQHIVRSLTTKGVPVRVRTGRLREPDPTEAVGN